MKKLRLLIILLLILPIFAKAGSVSLSGGKTISPGETGTFSVIVSSNNKIVGLQMVVSVDGDDFEILINKTTSSYRLEKNTSKNSFEVYTTSGNIPNKGTAAKIYIKAKSSATPGSTATLSLKNVLLSTCLNQDYDAENKKCNVPNDESASNYSTTLTVGAIKSTNNYLSSLEITGYDISFSKTTNNYKLSSTEIGKQLSIKATTEDDKATVKVSSPALVEGDNTLTVTVTAESGAKRVYTITVSVPKKAEVKNTDTNLKSLEVVGYDINFDPAKTEYLLNVGNDVTKLEINSTLENPKSSMKMDGPEELKVGENNYTITVTDEAGNTKKYNIMVNRKEAKVECEECQVCTETNSNDTIWKILAIALVIVTLAETIFMVTMRDKKKI